MQIIWYNTDLKQYRFGDKSVFKSETQKSQSTNPYTILVKLDSDSPSLANKIIKQLNIASELPMMYAY